jgi:hypothetical protein
VQQEAEALREAIAALEERLLTLQTGAEALRDQLPGNRQ